MTINHCLISLKHRSREWTQIIAAHRAKNPIAHKHSCWYTFTRMSNFLASIILGVCIFLGNISSQSQSYKIFDHIASDHSSKAQAHKHHHGHVHKHAKKAKSQGKTPTDHHHNAELSALNIHLALPVFRTISLDANAAVKSSKVPVSIDQQIQLSFPTSIFRPPIA